MKSAFDISMCTILMIDAHIKRKKDEAYYIEKFEMDFDKEWKKDRAKMYEEQLTNLMFLEKEPKEVLKHVDRAHDILKTIWSYNKLERKDVS